MARRAINQGLVLGYHGCDRETGERVLAGKQGLTPNTNAYDWLGHGVYFWEDDWIRAEEWATERMAQPNSKIQNPFVVGAIIDPGLTLSLLRRQDIELTRGGYKALCDLQQSTAKELPQ